MRELSDAIDEAVASAIESPVVKWAIVVEILGGDGDRVILTDYASGTTAWDYLGLLSYAVQQEQAEAIVRQQDN